MKRSNKPVRNYQKKKYYYTNRNIQNNKKDQAWETWINGSFELDPKTLKVKHIPKK